MSEALKGLGANGWTTPSESILVPVAIPAAVMAQADANGAPPISKDQLNTLIRRTLSGTVEGPVSQRFSRLLNLTRGDEKLIVKQFFNKTETVSHLFSVPVDGSIDLLVLINFEKDRVRWIVTDRSGRLLPGNAGAVVRRGEQPMLLTEAETQELYRAEMSIWTETADQIKSY